MMGDESFDGLPLSGVELGIITTDEPAQDCQSAAVQVAVRCLRRCRHGPSSHPSS